MPVVKAELGFFQVQFEGLGRHAIELGKPPFDIDPERLDVVDVVLTPGKLVIAAFAPDAVRLEIRLPYSQALFGNTCFPAPAVRF